MDTKTEKIIGYSLLGLGLIFILIAAHSVFTVFTGSPPPDIFKMDSIVLNVNNGSGGTNGVELVSGKIASQFLNMISWYILMFFIAQAGGKIAGLGIQLIKEIRVTVKSKDGLTTIPTE